ncbi:hypothetical protein B0T11DRAFT_72411 [Plectosphaerella cucumerina]|uniref:Uncharacterized protein n=1 Tax=Plectosphaerella cucumerina TaxID=40658 RepID=A0A8K0TTI6_9PEZI|nr:hypothetical protein B0T11DRAFT_72411 [Plectosphaerella cucumerina]
MPCHVRCVSPRVGSIGVSLPGRCRGAARGFLSSVICRADYRWRQGALRKVQLVFCRPVKNLSCCGREFPLLAMLGFAAQLTRWIIVDLSPLFLHFSSSLLQSSLRSSQVSVPFSLPPLASPLRAASRHPDGLHWDADSEPGIESREVNCQSSVPCCPFCCLSYPKVLTSRLTSSLASSSTPSPNQRKH